MSERKKRSVLIIAGEASGDIHGAELIHQLKLRADIDFFGIGGDRMIEEGLVPIYHVKEMSFFGLSGIVRYFPFIYRVFRKMKNLLKSRCPEIVILVDYPGFNLAFAREVKKQHIPVIYFISPQVWAWRKGRIKKIVRRIDRLLVIFSFEEALYKKEGLDVKFVGHPLKDVVKAGNSKKEFFKEIGLDFNKETIGLLPGSREREVTRLLPEMIKACHILLKKQPNIQFLVGIAPTLPDEIYDQFLDDSILIHKIRGRTYDVITHADAIMAASGTATLECAILGTPLVIVYRVSRLEYIVGRIVVKLKVIGLVNIVAGRKIVSELIQNRARGELIAEEIYTLITDNIRREKMKKDLKEVSSKLGDSGATVRAAEAVMEYLEKKSQYDK